MTVPKYVRVPWYWVLVGVMCVFISPPLSILASVKIANNNRAEAAEQARKEACTLIGKLLDVYVETPPSTPAGLGSQQAYLDYYNINLHCEPGRRL